MAQWITPQNPTPLLQEHPDVQGEPWRLLVVCSLCNKTRGAVASPVAVALFSRWPTAEEMAEAPLDELAAMLRPIGLHRKRATLLRAMSRAFAAGFGAVEELPGVGQYARDAWTIFVEGRTDVQTTDGHLGQYVAWRKAAGTWLQDGGSDVHAEKGNADQNVQGDGRASEADRYDDRQAHSQGDLTRRRPDDYK